MATNWLDILPHDVKDVVETELAKNHMEDLMADLRAELLQDIPGDDVWVDNPTLYHRLVLELREQIIERTDHMPKDIIKQWAEDLELDIFDRMGVNAVLDVWQDQQRRASYIQCSEKKKKIYMYYITSFLNILPYQNLLSLRRFLDAHHLHQ